VLNMEGCNQISLTALTKLLDQTRDWDLWKEIVQYCVEWQSIKLVNKNTIYFHDHFKK
jgi:hypothetical protein